MTARVRRAGARCGVVAIAVSAAVAGAGPATAQVAGRNGIIVFDYSPPGGGGTQIWSVDPTTGSTRNLSGANQGDDQPAVSPDGRSIAFRRANAIWTMTVTGGSRRAITSGAASDSAPTWSPDGASIAFAENGDLAVVPARGGTVRTALSGGDNSQPAWSPDGTALAFTSYRVDDTAQVFTVALDGSHLVDISQDTTVSENNPDWSPDSTHVVFTSNRSHDGERESFQANRDGSGIVQVSASLPSGSYDPAVSPDGRQLAFTVNHDGAVQIAVEPLNGVAGSGQIVSALQGTSAENLSWQPVVRTTLTVPATVTRQQATTVKLAGFGARENVVLAVVDSGGVTTRLRSVRAGASGGVTTTVTLPTAVRTGAATITATGAVTHRVARASTTVD